jgi:hypothetical protein
MHAEREKKTFPICAGVKTGRTTELIQARQITGLFSADLLDISKLEDQKSENVR